MNMNLKLNLSLKPEDLKKLLPVLHKATPYIVGLALIGVFAYTALVVNASLNVKPSTATTSPAPKISFDKATIESLKNLTAVQGTVPTGNLGGGSPF